MTGPVGWFHGRFIHTRRVEVLANHFADLIAPDARVLGIGCGDGMLAARVMQLRQARQARLADSQ